MPSMVSTTAATTITHASSAPARKTIVATGGVPSTSLIANSPFLQAILDPRHGLKVVRVAEKYSKGNEVPLLIPEATTPQGSHAYALRDYKFWTGGFFPGCIWALVERLRLLPNSKAKTLPGEDEIVRLARLWQESQRELANPALDHDQGFRFCPTFGRELDLFHLEDDKEVLINAANSLVDRFNEKLGLICSWDDCHSDHGHYKRAEAGKTHFLVIMDNMMNLQLLYLATRLTANQNYTRIADIHAENTARILIRPDWGTYHVVNIDPNTGEIVRKFQQQGWKDESTWSRGQGWGITGYADSALWTGNEKYIEIARKLADKFLDSLPEDGVPHWDFDHPRPTARDISAGMSASCGLLKIYQYLRSSGKVTEGRNYLRRGIKLVQDMMKLSLTPLAPDVPGKEAEFGEEGWETIFKNSTIQGHEFAPGHVHHGISYMDHGLVYADYYFLEFGNELYKLALRDEYVAQFLAKLPAVV